MTPSKKSHIYLLLYTLLLGFLMMGQALSSVHLPDFNDFTKTQILSMKLGQILSVIVLFILPSVIYVIFFTPEKWKFLQLKKPNNSFFYVICLIFFLGILPLIQQMGIWNQNLHLPEAFSSLEQTIRQAESNTEQLMIMFLRMDNVYDLLINLLVIALMAALSEELFFRGVLQNHLHRWTKSAWAAVLISSILFSALHAQFLGFFPRMVLGIFLGFFYIWSNSLWVPIIGHFINNASQVLWIYFYMPQVDLNQFQTMQNEHAPWYFVMGSLILSASLFYFLNKRYAKINSLDRMKEI